jgi:MFS transporter, DHA1 family, multidrug resistance protein
MENIQKFEFPPAIRGWIFLRLWRFSLITTKRILAPSYVEFIVVLSMMMALTALSIDAMLPALSQIGTDLNITNPNDRQLVVSLIFLGLSAGQLFFGPLSDKIGRKQAIYSGYALFMVGSLVSIFSPNFTVMLVGRALQGLGVSAPRAVSLAMVRDLFEGRKMARVMSFAMSVFILVPIIAPMIGQGIMSLAGWRSIFGSFLLFALGTLVWFALRFPETLASENRTPFSFRSIVSSVREILKIRLAFGYILTAGMVFGVFLSYLTSSQQIFQEQYALGELFPYYFAAIALSLGIASFLNARLVMRYEMTQLVRVSLAVAFGLAVIFLGISIYFAGHPPLWIFLPYLMVSFFFIGVLFGNINTLAMQPLGKMAGIGSAVVGSLSTLISMVLGTMIGRSYNGTVLPLVIGMAVLTGVSIFVARWAESK